MEHKEVYDEIFGNYVNSERYKKDYDEIGCDDVYERVEEALQQIAPEQYKALSDAISTPMHDILQMGFYCGIRETYRHMMRAEVLA